jgi:hypothetical protein
VVFIAWWFAKVMPVNRRDLLASGALVAGLLALALPLARIGVDPHHDGGMLKPAMDVLSGQVLFRDSFMQYGALSCYLQVLALWIEPTLLSIRLLTVATYGVTLAVLYATWRLILPRALAVVAGLFFLIFFPVYEKDYWDHQYWLLLPWSSAFALLFQCVGLHALFRVIRGEKPESWSLVAGVACACVFWCRQPVGIMMTGSLIVIWPALHWAGWRPTGSTLRGILGRMAGGLVGVHALMFGGMAATGALPAWWYQNIAWPARWSRSVDWMDTLLFTIHPGAAATLVALGLALRLPALVRRVRPGWPAWFAPAYYGGLGLGLLGWREWVWKSLTVTEGGWMIVVPLVIAVQAMASLRQLPPGRSASRPEHYYLIGAAAAVALGSLLQYYPMADAWHIFYALAPAFGLVVFALWRWSGWPVPLVAGLLAAALLPEAWRKVEAMGPALNRPLVTIAQPAVLRGMRVPPEQAHGLGQIELTLDLIMRHRPDIPSAMIGDCALYLCLTRNQANPIPYYVTWRGLATQADNAKRWEYIARERPLMILHGARWQAVDEFYQREDYVPLLFVPADRLEIAVPKELADEMGVKAYGLFGTGRPGR